MASKRTSSDESKRPRHLVCIGDTHICDSLGLLSPAGVTLPDGNTIKPSALQRRLWNMWREFFDVFVPHVTKGEPFDLVHNGDVVEGDHHGATHPLTRKLDIQIDTAVDLLRPYVQRARRFYVVRGTPAHDGDESANANEIARKLGAVPIKGDSKQYARWELYKQVGRYVVHFRHHPRFGSSSGVSSTAVWREYALMCEHASRLGTRAPDCLVRSHWHTTDDVRKPSRSGEVICTVLPCWQAPTSYGQKRGFTMPSFGGMVISAGANKLEVNKRVWHILPGKAER